MSENKRKLGSDLSVLDAHVIQPEEYDELPEWTEAMAEAADVYEAGKRIKRGRPPKPDAKLAVKLRLDPDIVAAFKKSGAGWQTRINAVLRANLPK